MDFAYYFWTFARKSPYYEVLISELIDNKIADGLKRNKNASQFSLIASENKIINKILPKSSVRRELFKKIYYQIKPFPYKKMSLYYGEEE